MASTGELIDNLDYHDLRGMGWDCYDAILAGEPELLTRLADGEDLNEDTFAFETLGHGLDPGVASTAAALAAAGCVPMTSRLGGAGHYEDHPLVAFWCPTRLFETIEAAVKDAPGVTLAGVDAPGVMVYVEAGNLDAMRRFAVALAKQARPAASTEGA